MPDKIKKQASQSVIIHGEVPDAIEFMQRFDYFVVPLFSGSGMRVKILEAMAMGKSVISSPQALDGLQARPERDLITASSADEWIAQISRLFEDSATRSELAVAARQYVETKHAWSVTLQPLAELLSVGAPATQLPVAATA